MQEQSLADTASQRSAALGALRTKINALLPPQYQNCYDTVRPVSMGSAGLKYGPDGKVAWDEIWTSFCDLALAGGPAHRGNLLEAVPPERARAEPERYQHVVDEMSRGLWLVTGLPVLPHLAPGWVGVVCHTEEMAAWLVRAVVAENVAARHERGTLCLPAGPHFRLEKEIKNVVTALAKTTHYWGFHMSADQRSAATTLTATPLLEPATPAEALAAGEQYQSVVSAIERGIAQATGLQTVPVRNPGWVAVPCDSEEMAVWLLRAVVVENVLVRREGSLLCLPANAAFARSGGIERLVTTFARAYGLWTSHLAQVDESRGAGVSGAR